MNSTTSLLTDRFFDALTFAAKLHNNQLRKGTQIPYVTHLMAVAGLVLEHGGNENEAIAGLLHDAIEDQAEHNGGAEVLRSEISNRFGAEVLSIVEGCTDADTFPKPPWRARKQAYIDHLAEASRSVLRVSCADKVHNARTLLVDYREQGEATWYRFNAGRDETLWYYASLIDVFKKAGAPGTLVKELDRVVDELTRLVMNQQC